MLKKEIRAGSFQDHARDPSVGAISKARGIARLIVRSRDGMARYEDLPYRTCVGVMLLNVDGLVFIGRRAGGIEHVDESHVWQMPQGGVDPGEDTWAAAKRELYEETSVRSVEKLGEVAEWLIYDIPRTVAGRAWKGRYRGQRQNWYAVGFTAKTPRSTSPARAAATRRSSSAGA